MPTNIEIGALQFGYYTFYLQGSHGGNEGLISTSFFHNYGYAINSIKSQTVLYPLNVESEEAEGAISVLKNEEQGFLKVQEALAYTNGLGKAIQAIAVKGSPSGKDVVTHMEYDEYGLQTKSYPPYVASTTTGEFISASTAKSDQESFYSSAAGIAHTSKAYAKTIVEKSPLLRTLEQGAVGVDWQPDATPKHTVRTEYGTNSTGEVLMFDAGTALHALSLNAGGHYPAGTLYKTIVINEDEKESVVYKDKSDKEILKESVLSGGARVQTYYVYDIFGNLRFIIPPEAIRAGNGSWSDDLRTKWVTEYVYDGYNRQIEKYSPEEQEVTTVYDYLGRVVLRQDGDFRANNEWLFTKYDKQSRVIMTGVCTVAEHTNRADMQTHVDGLTDVSRLYETRTADPVVGYTLTNAFPPITQTDIWTITYYDDYDFDNDVNATADAAFIQESDFSATDYDAAPYWIIGHAPFYRLQDKVTKTKVRHDINPALFGAGVYPFCPSTPNTLYYKGSSITLKPGFRTTAGQTVYIGSAITPPADQIRWLETVSFYDKYERVIQTQSTNHLEGKDVASTQYDFSGKVMWNKLTHMKDKPQKQVIVDQRFIYDAGGRLIDTYQKINNDEKLVSRLEYNELGQVIHKKLHQTTLNKFLQTLDYTYNERGWLQQVNDPYALGSDLFAFRLAYNLDERSLGNPPKWDGTISGMVVADKKADNTYPAGMGRVAYKYTYDNLGRLTEGKTALYNGTAWTVNDNYRESITEYDYNGNIKSLERKENDGSDMDRLEYAYSDIAGNMLKKVTDRITGSAGFVDGANDNNEYDYDHNGNLTRDLNKGITSITYNLLNLPTNITWANGSSIELLYSATGEKLRMTVQQTGGGAVVTDYVGGFEYSNNVLQHFAMSEGRVLASTYEYQYFLKDHLGNVRMTIKNGSTDADKIAQQDFYYPFGLRQSILMPGTGNNKLYNGKELVGADFGLNWYHYGARWYDPQIGRWTTMDPADEFHSPYVYVHNDPINFTDPDGSDENGLVFDKNGQLTDIIYDENGWDIVYGIIDDGQPHPLISFNQVDMSEKDKQSDRNSILNAERNLQLGLPSNLFIDLHTNDRAQSIVDYGLKGRNSESGGLFNLGNYKYAFSSSLRGGPMDYYGNNDCGLGKEVYQFYVLGNAAYNPRDAGNYLWGRAMSELGISCINARHGADVNNYFNGNRDNGWGILPTFQRDDPYDQQAIYRGYHYH